MSEFQEALLLLAAGAGVSGLVQALMWLVNRRDEERRRYDQRKPDAFAQYTLLSDRTMDALATAVKSRTNGRGAAAEDAAMAEYRDLRHEARRSLHLVRLLEPALGREADAVYKAIREVEEIVDRDPSVVIDDENWRPRRSATVEAREAFLEKAEGSLNGRGSTGRRRLYSESRRNESEYQG